MLAYISLLHGWLPTTIVVLGLLAVVLAFDWTDRPTWRRQVLWGIPITVALVALVALVDDGLALVPWQFPNSYYFWVGLVVLAIVIGVLGWRKDRNWRRVVSVLAVFLTFAMALTLVNAHYQYYPTVRSLFGVDAADQVNLHQLDVIRDQVRRTHRLPKQGVTITIRIPGELSGYEPRPAEVYLPPIWFENPRPALPMVELIEGTPGAPADWTRAANADQTANAFAAQHGGRAPILVMPDPNGSETGDTECVNSHYGQVGTYLNQDVPDFSRRVFGVPPGPNSIALAGLSAGGTCSIMITLRNPTKFRTFADYSGYQAPSVGEALDVPQTIQGLFDGNRTDYDQHDPVALLKRNRYEGMAGWFEVGTADDQAQTAQQRLVPLAHAAGIDICVRYVPGGGHDFSFWGTAFADSLPWLSWRLGLTPKPAVINAVCTSGAS